MFSTKDQELKGYLHSLLDELAVQIGERRDDEIRLWLMAAAFRIWSANRLFSEDYLSVLPIFKEQEYTVAQVMTALDCAGEEGRELDIPQFFRILVENFRTSYRRIDGFGYTVYPGEWICTIQELSTWFRTRFHWQALAVLDLLAQRHLISYTVLCRGKLVKYQICGWDKHNTVLDYNCPCQKDSGFFFMPVTVASELISTERCSEMDIVLDLWLSTVYNDVQVEGSFIGPVVYIRNGTGNPLVSYSELAARWGISKATVSRTLKKLEQQNYLSLMTFPGRTGSVIYLQNYLSTMFQISDVLIDKEEVAMVLKINISLPSEGADIETAESAEHEVIVPAELSCVSKPHIEIILSKMAKVLDSQGLSCLRCSRSKYMLFPLSDAWQRHHQQFQDEDHSELGGR